MTKNNVFREKTFTYRRARTCTSGIPNGNIDYVKLIFIFFDILAALDEVYDELEKRHIKFL